MRVLVIGGSRFIGAAAVRHLHAMGHTVAIFNRGQSTPAKPLPEDITWLIGDAKEIDSHADELRGFAPEVVLHNVVLNVGQIQAVQAIFRGVAQRLVLTSSQDVYRAYGRLIGSEKGDPLPLPVTEDSPLREGRYPYRGIYVQDENHPLWHYDKIPAEEAVMGDPELRGTIVRLPMVFGEGDFQRRLWGFVGQMRDNRPAIVLDQQSANWRSTYGYVENVGKALALAATDSRAAGQIFNVADKALSTLELAEMVKQAMGWRGVFWQVESDNLPQELRAQDTYGQDLVCSGEKISQVLDYTPSVTFEEAVRRTAGWDVANPPTQSAPLYYELQDEVLKRLESE